MGKDKATKNESSHSQSKFNEEPRSLLGLQNNNKWIETFNIGKLMQI